MDEEKIEKRKCPFDPDLACENCRLWRMTPDGLMKCIFDLLYDRLTLIQFFR